MIVYLGMKLIGIIFNLHQKKPHNVAFNYSFMNKLGAV